MPGGANTLTNCQPPVGTPILLTAVARLADSVRFSFNTDAGPNYTVEFKDDLSAPAWQILRTLTGTGGAMHVTNAPVSSSTRFYRVRTP